MRTWVFTAAVLALLASLTSTIVFAGSATAAPAGAVIVVGTAGDAVTETVRMAEAPERMLPPVKLTTPPVSLTPNPAPVPLLNVRPAGRVNRTVTPVASPSPPFPTVSV